MEQLKEKSNPWQVFIAIFTPHIRFGIYSLHWPVCFTMYKTGLRTGKWLFYSATRTKEVWFYLKNICILRLYQSSSIMWWEHFILRTSLTFSRELIKNESGDFPKSCMQIIYLGIAWILPLTCFNITWHAMEADGGHYLLPSVCYSRTVWQ